MKVYVAVATALGALGCSSSVSTSPTHPGGPGEGGVPVDASDEAGANQLAGDAGDCVDGGAALAGDIVDACGQIVPAAYRSMAAQLGTAMGIAYRYGPASTAPGSGPTWSHPADHAYDNHGNGSGWQWQVGGPESAQTDKNLDDYSSNMGQAVYVADASDDPGVTDLTTLLMGGNTFSESPQLPWVYYGGGSPDVNVLSYQKSLATTLRQPVAIGRCYGYFGWCSNAIVAFQNGLLATTGSNTASNRNTMNLPPGKVPTSVAITNAGEFALVTVWDTVNLKGQVAVIALAGTCDGCEPGGTKTPYDWWGEWGALYPGLRNLGDVGFMKLLGFVDLPGVMAPTEISASADYVPSLDDQQGWLCSSADGGGCRVQAHDLPLSDETNRQSFISGANKNRYSKSGFAVVLSKSERKAVFLDLKPLFAKIAKMYFGTAADFAVTQNVGQPDEQWPFAFSQATDFAPTVVKTVPLSEAPTAVKTSLKATNAAWIATVDGTLHTFTVGGYGSNAAATPDAITESSTVSVGKNPTCIAYAKHDPSSPSLNIDNEVIVISRGEQKIDWVAFAATGQGTTVLRTLSDSRLVDPVWAEDADNHGTESYVLSIADYGGKQIAQYRYGPVIFHTNPGAAGNSVGAACQPAAGCGMGPTGTDPFEFGGSYATAGGPFRVTSANVP